MPRPVTRRSLLAAVLPALAPGADTVPFSDYRNDFQVDAQPEEPRVKVFDLRRLKTWLTPELDFFAFHQGRTMRLSASGWQLQIGGFVARPKAYPLPELRSRPDVRKIAAVIECSGNSGHPALMNGLVSNAEWTGVPVSALLKECGIEPAAREVVFFGADTTKERKWSAGGTEIAAPHGRSLHVQDALDPRALVAFEMNGRPLPAELGFPLRLVLPGWYGMAQIKWLDRIEVLDRRYEGQHMARNYHSLHRLEDGTFLDTAITHNRLKSVVAQVSRHGRRFEIAGAAWGGPSPLRSVEVRIDNAPWRAAVLDTQDDRYAWRLWSIDWPDASPGPHELVSRAIDVEGRVQPTRDELKQRIASNREDHSQWVRRIVIPK